MRGVQPGRVTKFVPPAGHVHQSIRSCPPCHRAARALACKRWRNRLTDDAYAASLQDQRDRWKKRAAKKTVKRYCQSPGCVTVNGKPRQVPPRCRFCKLCRAAARSWTQTRYRNLHADESREKQRKRKEKRGFWHSPEENAQRRARYAADKAAKLAEQGGTDGT